MIFFCVEDIVEYTEPYLKERLDAALEKAKRLLSGKTETLEDLNLSLRAIISNHYNIPLLSSYYDDKTLDDLAFEVFYLKERNTTGSQTVSQAAQDNPEEISKVIEDQFAEFEDFKMPEPNEEEKQRMKDFFNTGKFKGEK